MSDEKVSVTPICGAKNRQGKPCRRNPMANSERCKLHGGATPKGPASPHYKHGQRSRYIRNMPPHLRAAFLNALSDKDSTKLTEQIALVESREVELISRLSPETSTALWHRARVALDDLREASRLPDDNPTKARRLAAAHVSLHEAVTVGVSNEDTWAQLLVTLESRRRLVDTERRRVEGLRAYLTMDQALAMIGRIVGVVRDNVSDRAALARIVDGVEVLLPVRQFESIVEPRQIDAGEIEDESDEATEGA